MYNSTSHGTLSKSIQVDIAPFLLISCEYHIKLYPFQCCESFCAKKKKRNKKKRRINRKKVYLKNSTLFDLVGTERTTERTFNPSPRLIPFCQQSGLAGWHCGNEKLVFDHFGYTVEEGCCIYDNKSDFISVNT